VRLIFNFQFSTKKVLWCLGFARFFEVVGLLKMIENFCFPMIIRTFVFANHL